MQSKELHINAALSNYAIDYLQGGNFIADRIMPVVPVIFEDGKYHILPDEERKNQYDTTRADGAPATETDWTTSEDSYSTRAYALKKLLTDKQIRNADSIIRLEQTALRYLLTKIRLDIESRIEALIDNISTFNYVTPSPKWDAASCTILGDILDARTAFREQAGIEPNTIVLPSAVADLISKDSTFMDLQKYTKGNLIETYGIPDVIKGMQVIIPGVIMNTAQPGLTASLGYIWSSDRAYLLYVEPNPGPKTFTVGNQFRVSKENEYPAAVYIYRDEARRGTFVEVEVEQDQKIISTDACYIINDVIT